MGDSHPVVPMSLIQLWSDAKIHSNLYIFIQNACLNKYKYKCMACVFTVGLSITMTDGYEI